MRITKYLTALLLALILFACSKPLPEERFSYIGEWRSKEMYLLILADGTVFYERLKNGGTTSVNALLQEFIGDDFVVDLSFLTCTLHVNKTPYQEDGKWFMVVDGVKLVKSEDEV